VLLLGASWVAAGLTPKQKCQAGKNQAAGKYAACLHNAEAKFVKSNDQLKHDKDRGNCSAKFTATWQKLEAAAAKAGDTCRDGIGRVGDFQAVINGGTSTVATGLQNENPLPLDLASCQIALAACQAGGGALLETGQTTCYDVAGALISCTDTGQDGEFQKGLARSYTDNSDGTITDNRSGLVWEKLARDGSVHDADKYYLWEDAFGKITQLNTEPCFAGHCDWRLPNVNELYSLIDYASGNSPKVQAAFDTDCTPGCKVTGCSCTAPAPYWSSTTYTDDPTLTWAVFLYFDDYVVVQIEPKNDPDGYYVRAVRGGS
jgi:hypothetical protein